ncbi:MAG: hypothetical protein HYU26_13725 [Candidatus Rokubacteria bacterium]|nr:hypothetical protein [Candidatus Rokubacteria bacterium]
MADDTARGGISHRVTAECAVPAARAFGFLVDGAMLGRWALGCWQTEARGEGLFVGRSLFDGGEVWVRPVGDERLLTVDYHVGASPDALLPRIMARVVPGPVAGRRADTCLVSLLAWRGREMDDTRWHRLVACHEVEILLIQALLRG